MPMDISELKSKKIVELNDIAKELGVQGYSDLRKQELIYRKPFCLNPLIPLSADIPFLLPEFSSHCPRKK